MRIPGATYRLQVHAGFTLHDTAELVEYLHALGITDLYLSPIFEAAPGSTHGYDVTDPTRIGSAIGGRAALDALHRRVQAHGMGLLLDIVPNHMAASEQSPWWRDVLHRGRDSEFATFYDIDWGTAAEPKPLLLPVLGGTPDEVIERDELTLEPTADGGCEIDYFGRRLPVAVERCDPDAIAEYERAEPARRRAILRDVLARQHYRLEHWTVAGRRLGYRRFFDITDLAGLRVEEPAVFEATHALIRDLVNRGIATGLRVDHVDGLRDPAGYLERLHASAPAYTLVEKILERDEPLPRWPIQGTTGYEFLNLLNGLFIEPDGHAALVRAYQRLTGESDAFADVVYRKKKLVMDRLFGGERAALAALLQPLLGTEFTADDAHAAVTELTAAMPVYRTYIRGPEIADTDRAALEHAFAELARRAPDLPAPLVRRLRGIVFLELIDQPEAALEFLARWQQFSGPVMAKGFEDTALYVYTPLVSANEVGGSPAAPAIEPAAFHERMQQRVAAWPHALSATATHDTKRGEDTRVRIDVLSELAAEWTRRFRAWVRWSEEHKEEAAAAAGLDEEQPVPNAKEESLLYQTIVGAWPLSSDAHDGFVTRINEYMRKAVREGKETTSWRKPDEDYEAALAAFVEELLEETLRPELRDEIGAFADGLAWHGALNALAQTLLKITCPGVPDFYQGTELWALTLVDPDNRQPVDYDAARARLHALEPLLAAPHGPDVRALLREWRSGDIKLYLTAAALRFRRDHAALFRNGSYLALTVSGERAAHVVAFARMSEDDVCLTVVTRLTTALCGPDELPAAAAWGDTRVELPPELQGRDFGDVLTGQPAAADLRMAELLRHCPVALLTDRPSFRGYGPVRHGDAPKR